MFMSGADGAFVELKKRIHAVREMQLAAGQAQAAEAESAVSLGNRTMLGLAAAAMVLSVLVIGVCVREITRPLQQASTGIAASVAEGNLRRHDVARGSDETGPGSASAGPGDRAPEPDGRRDPLGGRPDRRRVAGDRTGQPRPVGIAPSRPHRPCNARRPRWRSCRPRYATTPAPRRKPRSARPRPRRWPARVGSQWRPPFTPSTESTNRHAASARSSASSTASRSRPTSWRSTLRSKRPAPANKAGALPSSRKKCGRWPAAARRRPGRSAA